MALTKSQLKQFKEWMEDGNVSKNNDGTYSTQDAQYRNKLKDLNELKKYFKKEFIVDEYEHGGSMGDTKNAVISYLDKNKFNYVSKTVNGRFSIKIDDKSFDHGDAIKLEKLGDGISTSSQSNSSVWLVFFTSQYEKGGGVHGSNNKNGKYLDSISSDKKSKILKNIASHYRISVSDAEGEVRDADAEMLYEYITNEALRMDVYNDMERGKMAKGGGVGKDDNLISFTIPTWAVSSLVNGDDSGLENEDIEKLNKFLDKIVALYGNGFFMIGSDEDMEAEFSYRNDIDGTLGGDVVEMYLRPNKMAYGGSIEDENREMVLNENNQIIHHTKELPTAIKGKRVPAWVVTKVHESASDLSDATHYMDGQKMAKGGDIMGIDSKGLVEKAKNKVGKWIFSVTYADMIDGRKVFRNYPNYVSEYFNSKTEAEKALQEKLSKTNKMAKGGGVDVMLEVGDRVVIYPNYSSHYTNSKGEIVQVMPDGKTYEIKIKHSSGNEYVKFDKSELKLIGGKQSFVNSRFANGGEFDYDYYEVYDESTGKSLMIYAIDQEDAESIAEELDFESFEDGDEYNPNDEEYAKGGGVGNKSTKNTNIKKRPKNSQPKMVRQYFEDSPYSYAHGGKMDSQHGIDLFEDYENIPANVQSILNKYEDAFMDGDYKELQKALTQLKKVGYTFEYDLDGQAYDLRPIGTKGKSEMNTFENGGGMEGKKSVKSYFASINLDKLPAQAKDYINTQILNDSDIDLIDLSDEDFTSIQQLIAESYPQAIGGDMSDNTTTSGDNEDSLEDAIESLQTLLEFADEKERKSIEEAIEALELLV